MTLRSRGRFSEKRRRVPAQTFPGAILQFQKNNSATDQEKRSLKSMAHYSDAILRAHTWPVRTAGEARVYLLQSYVTVFWFIVWLCYISFMSMITKIFMLCMWTWFVTIVVISSHACLTEANLGGFLLPSQSESEFGLFAMYVTQTRNLLWQEGANNKHIRVLN